MTTQTTLRPLPHSDDTRSGAEDPKYLMKGTDHDSEAPLPSLDRNGRSDEQKDIIQGESEKQLKRYSLAFSLTTFGVSRLISSSLHPRWASIDE